MISVLEASTTVSRIVAHPKCPICLSLLENEFLPRVRVSLIFTTLPAMIVFSLNRYDMR